MRRPPVWCAAALLVAGLFVSVAAAPPAAACSCAAASDRAMARSADAVFVGSVSDIDFGDGTVEYTFDVQRTWSGEVLTTAVVSSHPQEAACGLPALRFGERRLVLATSDDDGTLVTGLCSGGGAASDRAVAAVDSALGPGTDPAAAGDQEGEVAPSRGPSLTALGAAAAVAVGLAGLVVVRRRRQVRRG